MAGGEAHQPPPPHEDGVEKSSTHTILPNSSTTQPHLLVSLSPRINQRQINYSGNKAHTLEDGEITPSPVTAVPAIPSRSYSKIVQGHKPTIPDSEAPTDDTSFVCEDSVTFKPLSMFEGKPCVVFKSSEKKTLINNLKYVLVGKFSYGRPPLSSIKVFFGNLKLQGRYNLSIFDNKHLFIELELKTDYVKVWLKLIWSVAGFAMRIFKWGSDFTPGKESATAPVWIRIEGVPLYLFDKLSLLSFANAIGQPLSVHPLNANRVKLNSALICVELDVSTPLMDSIYVRFEDDISPSKVEGLWLKVFYDVVPPYCSSCLHIGHNAVVCKQRKSVFQTAVTHPDENLELGLPANQRPEDSPQPAVTSVFAPPPSIPVEQKYKNKQKATKPELSQVWKEVKTHGTLKMQQTSSIKENNVSNVNRFTALISEPAPDMEEASRNSASDLEGYRAVEHDGVQEFVMDAEQCGPATIVAARGPEIVPEEAESASPGATVAAHVTPVADIAVVDHPAQIATPVADADSSRPQGSSRPKEFAAGSRTMQQVETGVVSAVDSGAVLPVVGLVTETSVRVGPVFEVNTTPLQIASEEVEVTADIPTIDTVTQDDSGPATDATPT